MYTTVEQMQVDGKPCDINIAIVTDLEGQSLIATFSSPATGKSYALFEKYDDSKDKSISGQIDNLCLRACRAIIAKEPSIGHVLYRDYLLSNQDQKEPEPVATREEVEAMVTRLKALKASQPSQPKDEPETFPEWVELGVSRLISTVEKHIKFEQWLKENA